MKSIHDMARTLDLLAPQRGEPDFEEFRSELLTRMAILLGEDCPADEVRDGAAPKKRLRLPINLVLSPEARAKLDVLAAGSSRSATVERLVLAAPRPRASSSR